MNQEQESLQHLKEIRSLMERSTKFISLSGLAGVVAGSIALVGAWIQYLYMKDKSAYYPELIRKDEYLIFTVANFMLILVLALLSAYFFTVRKAKKNNQSVWDSSSRRLLMNLAWPLACGAMFCVVLYNYRLVGLVAPATLIFYGLALINGSNFTLRDIRYLGIIQIILGFISAFNIGWGLLFWALGFGVMHIIYGIVMYVKYDRVN